MNIDSPAPDRTYLHTPRNREAVAAAESEGWTVYHESPEFTWLTDGGSERTSSPAPGWSVTEVVHRAILIDRYGGRHTAPFHCVWGAHDSQNAPLRIDGSFSYRNQKDVVGAYLALLERIERAVWGKAA
jgi:hypothetical protein